MKRIRLLTAGESHGKALVAVIEGLPAGLRIDLEDIQRDLRRRRGGLGRGARMRIERDEVTVLSGLRGGATIGSPVALAVENLDWRPDGATDVSDRASAGPITAPRPGHADLAGCAKYGFADVRDVLERASARETAARCAAGAVGKALLSAFGVALGSHVLQIGPESARADLLSARETLLDAGEWSKVFESAESSPVRCADPEASSRMADLIGSAREAGDTVGGIFEVVATGLLPGLGSYAHWDRRLDGALGRAVMSIPGIKGVEIGAGFSSASRLGSAVHDAIYPGRAGIPWTRLTNRAGGLEGGVTNGMPVVIRAAMKPIATLMSPLDTVDILTGEPSKAAPVRSDVCAVPAAAVVGEAMAALVLADALLEKFGGDSVPEIEANYQAYLKELESRKGGIGKCGST